MTTIAWVIQHGALSVTALRSGTAAATEALAGVGTRHTRWATGEATRSCSGRAPAACATTDTLSIIATHPIVASVSKSAVGVETGISLGQYRRGNPKAGDDKAEQNSQPCASHKRLRGASFCSNSCAL